MSSLNTILIRHVYGPCKKPVQVFTGAVYKHADRYSLKGERNGSIAIITCTNYQK